MNLSEAVKLAKVSRAISPGYVADTTPLKDQALIALLEFAERQHKDLADWEKSFANDEAANTTETLILTKEARAAGIGD